MSLVAWLSLGGQVRVLLGSRGLLPVRRVHRRGARRRPGVSVFDLPTLSGASTPTALLAGGDRRWARCCRWRRSPGSRPRLCFALSTVLYLSYAAVGRDFLSFQWDNLLLECGFLAAFLPADAPAPLVHFLFRLLLFKLYFESGIAKWQSPLRDWQDGSAMTYYYETAPLPTWLAFTAHHLPVWWHHLESRATLVLELVGPVRASSGRAGRASPPRCRSRSSRSANAATANYGFFCYLAAALGVFLLDDADVDRRGRSAGELPAGRGSARGVTRLLSLPPAAHRRTAPAARRAPLAGARGGRAPRSWSRWSTALYELHRAGAGAGHRGAALRAQPAVPTGQHLPPVRARSRASGSSPSSRRWPRAPTDARADEDGAPWTPQYFRHKPGDPRRAPDFVAPHQPRVDFQLWFYGLAFRRREPAYVSTLVERMCEDPAAVQPLFRATAPRPPRGRPPRLLAVPVRQRRRTARHRRLVASRAGWR